MPANWRERVRDRHLTVWSIRHIAGSCYRHLMRMDLMIDRRSGWLIAHSKRKRQDTYTKVCCGDALFDTGNVYRETEIDATMKLCIPTLLD
eukprot:2350595-Amphidinium_carterae.1